MKPLRRLADTGRSTSAGSTFKERLILEIDGRTYHQARADMEKDRIKDAFVQRQGWRIIRITDMRFNHDRSGCHADLLAFLRPSG